MRRITMEVKVKKLPKSQVSLEIKEDAKKMQKYFDQAYEKLAKTVTIDGFRPGKAPKMLTIDAIGKARYYNEALNTALPMIYSEAVKKEKIVPVKQPNVEIKEFSEEKGFSFTATVDVLPEVKLGDYKKISIKHKDAKIEVKKEDVEKVVQRLLHQSANYKVKDGEAKNGDRMEISFIGKVDGVMKDQYCSKHYPFILGEGVLLPGFEKELIGAKKDDNKKFELKIKNPQTKKEDMVNFDVTINEVWDVELPKLDKDFVGKFGHKSEKALRDAIENSIKGEKVQRERQIVEEKILDQLLKKVKMEIPESMIEQEVNRRVETIKQQTGPAFPKYLENMGKDLATLQKDIRPVAKRAVEVSLAMSEIAKDMKTFDPGKLGKDMKKNHDIQANAIKEAMDKLIEIARK